MASLTSHPTQLLTDDQMFPKKISAVVDGVRLTALIDLPRAMRP